MRALLENQSNGHVNNAGHLINNKKYIIAKFIIIIIVLLLLIISLFFGIYSFILIKTDENNDKNNKENNNINCTSGSYAIYDNTGKKSCKKCSIEDCDICLGNEYSDICLSCIYHYIPIYKNYIMEQCHYFCGINEKNIYSSDDNKNDTKSCDYGYILIDGKCILNYSFKAIYKTSKIDETISLINSSFLFNIKEMIIDNEIIMPSPQYTFSKAGEHSAYFLMDLNNIKSLYGLFAYVKNMYSISFTSCFDTENIVDMSILFYNCTNLETVDVSNFNTINVIDMTGIFFNCHSLKSIDLSSFNTKNVKNIRVMFFHCYALTSINLTSFNTEKVTDMGFMFYYCNSLRSINITNFNTKNVKDMKYMFYACWSLNSIDISNFNTENVLDMSYMFSYSRYLISIDLSNFKTEKVLNMSNMFASAYYLTSIKLSNFNTKNVEDMEYMFYDCYSLKELDLSSFNTEKVTNMYGMFYECSTLLNLDISSFKYNSKSTSKTYMDLFYRVPYSSKIIIQRSFYDKIKNQFDQYSNIIVID